MRKKLFIVIGIFFSLVCLSAQENNASSSNSIIIENIGELRGNLIGIYVFEKLPLYGHYEFFDTSIAIQYFELGNEDTDEDTITVDLVVPISYIYNRRGGKDADGWKGTGDYYVAILNMVDNFVYYPEIKDTYIFMDANNTPVKVSFTQPYTTLDFKEFKKGTEFYHMEIFSLYENDLLFEYEEDPLYTDDYYYENDLLIDVLYNGDITLLDNAIEPNKLIPFNSAELQLLRYMIFAKNGYRFRSDFLRNYFSRFSWYNGEKSFVQLNMTDIDWQNIRIIQDFEEKTVVYNKNSSLGEHFSFTGQITRVEHPVMQETVNLLRKIIRKLIINGEITAKLSSTRSRDRTEIARGKIDDGQFQLGLKEIPPDTLGRWDRVYENFDKIYCSDPEIKIAIPSFHLSGTYIDLYGIEQPINNGIDESGRGYYDFFYYLYSDRDAVIQGMFEGDVGYSNGFAFIYKLEHNQERHKAVFSVSLKKGWNKIKYSIIYNGKYIIQKTESSSESSGFYGLELSW